MNLAMFWMQESCKSDVPSRTLRHSWRIGACTIAGAIVGAGVGDGSGTVGQAAGVIRHYMFVTSADSQQIDIKTAKQKPTRKGDDATNCI
jgi:hypothetical protein